MSRRVSPSNTYRVKVFFKNEGFRKWNDLNSVALAVPNWAETGFVAIHWATGRWTFIAVDDVHSIEVTDE